MALQAATEKEKEAFRQACSEEAVRLEKDAAPGHAKTAEFIRGLPESGGI